MTKTERAIQLFLTPKSKPKEIAFGVGLGFVLTAIGVMLLGLASGQEDPVMRTIVMMIFLTLAPLISFVGLSANGSAVFTATALLIYMGLWVFAVRKLDGFTLRVAAVVLVASWMVFGMWASSSVY